MIFLFLSIKQYKNEKERERDGEMGSGYLSKYLAELLHLTWLAKLQLKSVWSKAVKLAHKKSNRSPLTQW